MLPQAQAQVGLHNMPRQLNATQAVKPSVPQASLVQPSVVAIPANYYTQHLSFFCRQERIIEKYALPLKIRAGSLDDCNRLEQKPGSYMTKP